MERNEIKRTLRECLLRENDEMDEYLDLINQKGIDGLNYNDLKDAPQSLINEFMEKAIKNKVIIDANIIPLVNEQSLIDKYLLMKMTEDTSMQYNELKWGSKEVIDEYIKKKSDRAVKIRSQVLELASEEVVDDYIKKVTDLGVFLDMEQLKHASEEAKEYYKNNKAQTPLRR